MNQGKIENYFPGGNTAKGFYSFYDYLPYKCQKVYIIKGGPGTGKSTTMKNIGKKAVNRGYNIEYHWCSSDNDSIDGIVIPDKKTAILDGTAPHTVDPKYPGAVEEIINVGKCWNTQKISRHKNKIIKLNQKISEKFKQTYRYLSVARIIYQNWEDYYQKHFNNIIITKTVNNLLGKILPNFNNYTVSGLERHLFGSAITPKGLIDFFNEITKNISKRYILNGKPEKKKTKIIKKVGQIILENGYNVLFLHCSFNPENIDGIIIRELDTAVINETRPHIIDSNKNDEIINLLKGIDASIISGYSSAIKNSKKNFNLFLNKAISRLHRAKILHDELEEYYIKAMDFEELEKIQQNLIRNIFSFH
ncbi:MAG: hypothetical protein ACOCP5_03805 [Halanaerobiaceae bacterium]